MRRQRASRRSRPGGICSISGSWHSPVGGRLSQDSTDARGDRSRRRASVASNVCRGVDMNGHKHERTWVPPLPDASLAWATTQISKKCKGRRYMLAASSLQYVSVRHDHAVEVPTENGIDRATGRGPISDRTCSHQAMRPEMSWRSQEPKEHRRIGTLLCRKVEDQIREYNCSA